jgi:hypothetical protein
MILQDFTGNIRVSPTTFANTKWGYPWTNQLMNVGENGLNFRFGVPKASHGRNCESKRGDIANQKRL